MPRTITYDYNVGGLPMNDPADRWWVLDGSTVALGVTRRPIAPTVPGLDGVVPWYQEDITDQMLTLLMAVNPYGPDNPEKLRSALFHHFNSMSALTIERIAYGTSTFADGKLSACSDLARTADGSGLMFTVVFNIPGAYFRDETADTWTQANPGSGTIYTIDTLDGGTAPVKDALIRISGPIAIPNLLDVNSGTGFVFRTLGSGERVIVNAANYTAYVVTTDTWSVSAGTDATKYLAAYGPGSADRPITLLPRPTLPDIVNTSVKLKLTASGTAGTELGVQARRAFL
jgi:hypothetical protein